MTIDKLKTFLKSRNIPYQITNNTTIINTSNLFNNIKKNYLLKGIFTYNKKYYKINIEHYIINGITYNVETFYDVTELIETILTLKIENEKLKQDCTTGLSTRNELDNYLKSLNTESVIVMCDIDNFKLINDTYGHPKGDIILKELGNIIKNNIRESDFAGRYGGEEFLIIFNTNNVELIKQRIDKINYEFANCGIIPNISFSAGISLFNQSKHIKEVIDEADSALYEAKNSGKNKSIIYNDNIPKTRKKIKGS